MGIIEATFDELMGGDIDQGVRAAGLGDIDAFLRRASLEQHPFIRELTGGTVERDRLRRFAGQFFHLVDGVPRLVALTHAHCGAPLLRQSLLQVLVMLELQPPSASELWLRTCAALGLSSDDVRSGVPAAATVATDTSLRVLAEGDLGGAVAMLHALLERKVRFCEAVAPALEQHYDLYGGPGAAFFEVVGFGTRSQLLTLRELLEGRLAAGDDPGSLLDATMRTVAAVDGLLTAC